MSFGCSPTGFHHDVFCTPNYSMVNYPPEVSSQRNLEEVWIGLSSVLCPRQHSIGYMGDGNLEEVLKYWQLTEK